MSASLVITEMVEPTPPSSSTAPPTAWCPSSTTSPCSATATAPTPSDELARLLAGTRRRSARSPVRRPLVPRSCPHAPPGRLAGGRRGRRAEHDGRRRVRQRAPGPGAAGRGALLRGLPAVRVPPPRRRPSGRSSAPGHGTSTSARHGPPGGRPGPANRPRPRAPVGVEALRRRHGSRHPAPRGRTDRGAPRASSGHYGRRDQHPSTPSRKPASEPAPGSAAGTGTTTGQGHAFAGTGDAGKGVPGTPGKPSDTPPTGKDTGKGAVKDTRPRAPSRTPASSPPRTPARSRPGRRHQPRRIVRHDERQPQREQGTAGQAKGQAKDKTKPTKDSGGPPASHEPDGRCEPRRQVVTPIRACPSSAAASRRSSGARTPASRR